MRTGGQLIVDCLEAQGVDRVFCVPGESYLAVLDALYDSAVDTVAARHESGAAMMAEADGKMTGRPGVAMVTRGPGATNAAAGVHIAKQDSTPMVLFVGQIGRRMRGREAFQEVDYRQTFGDLAKWVEEIEWADRIPEVLNHAWSVAMAGRPGPVVLALPEDMLRETAAVTAGGRVEPVEQAPTPAQVEAVAAALTASERPFVVAGGSRWSADDAAALARFATAWDAPVGCSFRRQQLFDHRHPCYAGDVGLGINPALRARINESDFLMLLGARLSENPSQDFSLLGIPEPGKRVAQIHPGPEELGRIYRPEIGVAATPGAFLRALEAVAPPSSPASGRAEVAHRAYLDWTAPERATPASAAGQAGFTMGDVILHLRETLPEDAVIANGAGNYAIWAHRFHRYRGFGTQLAPTSGSMGYGLPAAIAAKRRNPARLVVCLAGDGCFQMTLQELGTAAQLGAAVVVLVADNAMYGTIRMHQEKTFPNRIVSTDLENPDFAALARAYGAFGETVSTREAFPEAFARARAAGRPAVLHLRLDRDIVTPSATLADLRGA